VSLLRDFDREMWEDQNKHLHDPGSEDCRKLKGAAVNAEIQQLYNKVDS